MSFDAKLTIDGAKQPITVQSLSYSISQATDGSGFPTSGVYGGRLAISIEAQEDFDAFALAIDPKKHVSGKIEFGKIGEQGSALKTLTFTDAYLVGFSESFSPGSAMYQNLDISARSIKFDGTATGELANEWPNFKKK